MHFARKLCHCNSKPLVHLVLQFKQCIYKIYCIDNIFIIWLYYTNSFAAISHTRCYVYAMFFLNLIFHFELELLINGIIYGITSYTHWLVYISYRLFLNDYRMSKGGYFGNKHFVILKYYMKITNMFIWEVIFNITKTPSLRINPLHSGLVWKVGINCLVATLSLFFKVSYLYNLDHSKVYIRI